MMRLPSGRSTSCTCDPAAGAFFPHLDLDDLELLVAEVQQVHEPVGRDLVLDQAQDQVGGADRRADAQQLEVLAVARVVDARR